MTTLEDLLRELAPQVLGAVVRRYGHFDLAEDAVQEALLAAATQWPGEGLPDSPRAWLITVAARRLTDLLRQELARQRREDEVARWALPEASAQSTDDTLVLLFMCCHPSLSAASQIALTLRAVGGLTTEEVARAFLVPAETMTRRITRAKKSIKDSRIPFGLPSAAEWPVRLDAVLHVLYLTFHQGYLSERPELTGEAIRLARMVHRLLPDDSEVTGLLALMLLTEARRAARSGSGGEPIPMAEQDRRLWDTDAIAEGVALLTGALGHGPAGAYQLQAAIAALHDEASSAAETDWPQIVALYEVLMQISRNPVVELNHAVAVAMVHGPSAGLDLVEGIQLDDHRPLAVRAHLLEMSGAMDEARAAYEAAAARALNPPQQRYLRGRAARL